MCIAGGWCLIANGLRFRTRHERKSRKPHEHFNHESIRCGRDRSLSRPTIPRTFACACARTVTPTSRNGSTSASRAHATNRLRMTFENAADCAFADGWRDYRAVASYDRINWFRVPTRYDGRVMTIEHTPDFDAVYYAYFEPYSEERHAGFLGAVQQMPHATLTELGTHGARPADVAGDARSGRRERASAQAEEERLDHRASASGRDDGRMVRRRAGQAAGGLGRLGGRPGRAQCSSITPCFTSCRT